jgi:DNA-binding YbaB/EbfC family protein
MFGNMDLNVMMKKLQESMAEADTKTYTATAGGGMVEATANGKFEIIDLKIDETLLDDKESMQILIMSAVNDAIKMALEDKKSQALNMFGGLNLGQ